MVRDSGPSEARGRSPDPVRVLPLVNESFLCYIAAIHKQKTTHFLWRPMDQWMGGTSGTVVILFSG